MLKSIKFVLPATWSSYLINGDESSLSLTEIDIVNEFLAKNKLPAPVSCSENAWLAKYNDSGNRLAGDVLEYTFLLPQNTVSQLNK